MLILKLTEQRIPTQSAPALSPLGRSNFASAEQVFDESH